MRTLILSEIRRLAELAEGKPPGAHAFAKATGITEGKWRGVIWARWGDALTEAGFERNLFQERLPDNDLLLPIANLTRQLGRLPTRAELKLQRKLDRNFPSPGAITRRYRANDDLVRALREVALREGMSDLTALLPASTTAQDRSASTGVDGTVYLLRSGAHYKIGRSDQLERRVKEIRVALPEAVTLIHSIRTDDASGIETYWHRRFADRRANGEWFNLTPEDVKAFCRRTFQ